MDQNFIAFHLAITTGMRQGEILGLRWKDIDFDKGVLYVRQTLSREGKTLLRGAKTKSSLRTIRLSDNILQMLKDHKKKNSKIKEEVGESYLDYDLVVCTRIGTPIYPRNLRRTLNRLIERAKVPKNRFHDLRYSRYLAFITRVKCQSDF
jgi:integrase